MACLLIASTAAFNNKYFSSAPVIGVHSRQHERRGNAINLTGSTPVNGRITGYLSVQK
jgi:hypothetical protein